MRKHAGKKILCLTIAMLIIFTNFTYARSIVKKDESVYVTLNQDGVVKEQIVSDWIHMDDNTKKINDVSILKNIVNLKGDEVPTINGNSIKWNPSGNDIFYQGTTDKKLPIQVKIKYYLNGKIISPKNIAGKTGKIKITIDFINKDFHSVNINGKKKSIATQFSTVALLDLPIETFKNVKVNTGEVIFDGSNQIVAFVAFPGLTKSFNIKQDIIKIPEGIVINADANKFKLGSIMIAATPKLPDIKEFNESKTINEFTYGIKQLSDATKKLSDGAAKLSNGQKLMAVNIASLNGALSSLYKGSKDLKNGIAKVGEGAKNLQDGSIQVNNGVKQLSESAIKLGEGADNLGKGAVDFAANSQTFVNGALKAIDGAAQIASKTGELSDGLNKIVAATEQIKQGQSSVATGAGDALNGIIELKAAKQKELQTLDLLIGGVDVLKKVATAIGQIPQAKELSDKLVGGLEQQNAGLLGLKEGGNQVLTALDKLQAGITAMKAGADKLTVGVDNLQAAQKNAADGAAKLAEGGKGLTEVSDQLKNGAKALSEGAAKLNDGGTNLSNGANQFSEGSKALVEGSTKLSNGLFTLYKGTTTLIDGSTKLSSGLGKASKGTTKLLKGANDITKGSIELSANMKKLNDQGVSKLNGKINSGIAYVNELIDIKNEVIKLSKNYNNFTGIGQNMDGNVKFIFKTDEIKLPK